MKLFWGALYDKLVADSNLVSLTGHASDDPKIMRYQPESLPEYPCLVFFDSDTTEWIRGYVKFWLTEVTFVSFAKDIIVCDNIISRIETLLAQEGKPVYSKYFDISNMSIVNNWTRIKNIFPVEYDEEKQVYAGTIVAEFNWYKK